MIRSIKRRLRTRARSWFFDTLRRAYETDEGREIAVSALNGLLSWRPRLSVTGDGRPYDDLGDIVRPDRDYAGSVFITARFRTGSTLLWNIFRHIESCRAYYEPLNERRWFDPARRGARVDATHRGVEEYWREYEGLHELGRWHREDWTVRALFMDESAWDPGLRRYLDTLIVRAAPQRAVLQCNRFDFRLAWLRYQFPGAAFVHLYRHPRDQWCSSLVTPESVPRDVTLGQFEPYDHFYLKSWAVDLRRHFPCIPVTDDTAPYLVFYLLWKLSYLFGIAYADHSLSFEELTQSPREQIARLIGVLSLDADPVRLARIVTPSPVGRWKSFAEDGWFKDQEAEGEALLNDLFGADRLHRQTRATSPAHLPAPEPSAPAL